LAARGQEPDRLSRTKLSDKRSMTETGRDAERKRIQGKRERTFAGGWPTFDIGTGTKPIPEGAAASCPSPGIERHDGSRSPTTNSAQKKPIGRLSGLPSIYSAWTFRPPPGHLHCPQLCLYSKGFYRQCCAAQPPVSG